MMEVSARKEKLFRRYAMFVIGYTLLVILWGSLVRITGSGAGCGQHWPTCHGEIVPLAPSMETFIEFFHRVTSGICVLAVVGLWLAARAIYPRMHGARRGAWLSFVFIIIESLIGAAIVVLQYVGEDDSRARAVWMAVHLANTFVLMAVLFFTLWSARTPSPTWRGLHKTAAIALWGAVASIMLVSMSGAVSALGHTLFPAPDGLTIVEHLRHDPWLETNYPMIVRVVHPALSMVVTVGIWWMCGWLYDVYKTQRRVQRASVHLAVATGAQVACGFLNIALSAPGWMQVTHLLMANWVWGSLLYLMFLIATDPISEDSGGVPVRDHV